MKRPHNCKDCRWQKSCVNPRYKKYWDKKKHNCPAGNIITKGQKFLSWIYKIL